MVTHSSILACRIPWTEEPGKLQSIGLQRVGHDSSNLTQKYLLVFFFLNLILRKNCVLNGEKETKPIISKYYILNVYILSPNPPIYVIIPNHSPPPTPCDYIRRWIFGR